GPSREKFLAKNFYNSVQVGQELVKIVNLTSFKGLQLIAGATIA
ncbi:hypothetical protein SS7213T_13327, partial [Staphylococcus simiae CCM 7213 = CCUG 51256]